MTTLQIELPEGLRRYVEAKAAQSGYPNAGDFVRELIEADQRHQSGRQIEQDLLEVVDGPFEEWSSQDIDDIKRAGTRIILESEFLR